MKKALIIAILVGLSGCNKTEDSKLSSNSHNDEQVVQNIEKKDTNEVLIPRSVEGDKGKYYLLEMKKEGDVIYALTKRVGVDTVGFTETETNCATQKMREIGYGEDTVNNMKKTDSSEWFDLQSGSSKSDLANFICSK